METPGFTINVHITCKETADKIDSYQPVVNLVCEHLAAVGHDPREKPLVLAALAAALIGEGCKIQRFNEDGEAQRET